MRSILAAGCALMMSGAAFAQDRLSFDDPNDLLQINRKIQCSTVDGEPAVYYWNGYAYSRRQGEADRRLFRVEGMNIRACVATSHPEYGDGYRLVSRELLLYLDPDTNEILSTWDNPWSGETVDVLHVANDPVNFTSYVNGPRGPLRWNGQSTDGGWWFTNTVPLFYSNPLASEFQREIGGTYHATEMFNFFGNEADVLDPDTTTADVHVGWVRMSDWLPWMRMQGREGLIYFSTAGRKLEGGYDALPDFFRAEIERHYPEYDETPPLDDERPNVTSWSYFLGVARGEIEAPDRGN